MKFSPEMIEWVQVGDGKPDSDTSVLIRCEEAESEPVWPGYWDDADGCWRSADGTMLSNVVEWAHMPQGSRHMYAIVWASGRIELKWFIPDGAVAILHGPEDEVADLVAATSRHGKGKSKGLLLVPGIPEANGSQTKAMDALIAHSKWLAQRPRKGITYLYKGE
jgi:hypothetical protein